jgi:hypothetical protein
MKINFINFFMVFFLILPTDFIKAQNSEFCNKIYGKWTNYKEQHPFETGPVCKKTPWDFDKNGTVLINDKRSTYKLENNCLKLRIGDIYNYSILKLTKDSLILQKKILPHETHNLYFIKND